MAIPLIYWKNNVNNVNIKNSIQLTSDWQGKKNGASAPFSIPKFGGGVKHPMHETAITEKYKELNIQNPETLLMCSPKSF